MGGKQAIGELDCVLGLVAPTESALETGLARAGARVAFAVGGGAADPESVCAAADATVLDFDGLGVMQRHRWLRWARGARATLLCVGSEPRHAVAAFEAGAAAYLARPFGDQELDEALARVARRLAAARCAPLLAELERRVARHRQRPVAPERLLVRTGGTLHLVPFADILWVRARRNQVELHRAQGTHCLRTTLLAFAERAAPHDFVRIGRSLLVRRGAVSGVVHSPGGGRGALRFAGGARLALTRSQLRAAERTLCAPAGGVPTCGAPAAQAPSGPALESPSSAASFRSQVAIESS